MVSYWSEVAGYSETAPGIHLETKRSPTAYGLQVELLVSLKNTGIEDEQREDNKGQIIHRWRVVLKLC